MTLTDKAPREITRLNNINNRQIKMLLLRHEVSGPFPLFLLSSIKATILIHVAAIG
jgi:hypothetical protein